MLNEQTRVESHKTLTELKPLVPSGPEINEKAFEEFEAWIERMFDDAKPYAQAV